MATVTLTIPNEYANIVVAALCDVERVAPTAANATAEAEASLIAIT